MRPALRLRDCAVDMRTVALRSESKSSYSACLIGGRSSSLSHLVGDMGCGRFAFRECINQSSSRNRPTL